MDMWSLVPVLVSIVLFLPAVDVSFFADDALIIAYHRASNARELIELFFTEHGETGFYRPIVNTSHSIEYMLWRDWHAGYHIMNIALHALCAWSVFQLSCHLWPDRRLVAIASSSLFAVHPIHTSTVVWISGRSDLLLTAFALLSILSLLLAFNLCDTKYLLQSGIFSVCSLLSKETAIVLPIALVMIAVFKLLGRRRTCPRRFVVEFALTQVIGILIYLALRVYISYKGVSIASNYDPASVIDLQRPLEAMLGILLNLGRLHAAFFLSHFSTYATNVETYLGIAGLCIVLILIIIQIRTRNLKLLFITACSLLTLLPVLHVLQYGNLRYFYMASAGWSLVTGFMYLEAWQAAISIVRIRIQSALIIGISALLMPSLALITLYREGDWIRNSRIVRDIVDTVSHRFMLQPDSRHFIIDNLPTELPGNITTFYNVGTLANNVLLRVGPSIEGTRWDEIDLIGPYQPEVTSGQLAFIFWDGRMIDLQRHWSNVFDFRAHQGYRGWWYLVDDNGTIIDLVWNQAQHAWWTGKPGSIVPFIRGTTAHPDARGVRTIQRWVSPFAGSAEVTVKFRDEDPSCGDGVLIDVARDSSVVRRARVDNGTTITQTLSAAVELQSGTRLDFIVDPVADGFCDTTYLEGHIELLGPAPRNP